MPVIVLPVTYIQGLTIDATDSESCLPVVQIQETCTLDTEQRAAKDALGRIVESNEVGLFLEILEHFDLGRRFPNSVSEGVEKKKRERKGEKGCG